MGICASEELTPAEQSAKDNEKAKSRDVDRQISTAQQSDSAINKLLLLGAGGSGKSTLFKQMIKIYGKGFSEKERKNYAPIIYNNMIVAMKVLIENSIKFGHPISDADSQAIIEQAKEEDDVDDKLGKALKSLWVCEGIQKTFSMSSKFQLNDSTKYFMEKVDDIMDAEFIPLEQDVLRSRVPTTGIVENAFEIDGNQFKMFDVGGQRSERKKWIHCFEKVTAVLFVASLSAYDQVLYEDETQNCMQEALVLFGEIADSEWFESTSMILFLNKKDLFEEKIAKVPLRDYFSEYEGENDWESASLFIQEMFESKNPQDKDIYPHFTCATDTNNIFVVFNYVKDIIIKKGLSRAGLM